MQVVLEPPNLVPCAVRAFFTTRSLSRDGDIFDALRERLSISRDRIYTPVQKHTSTIHVLESDREPVIADAVVTRRKNILIGVVVADCVPILLHDRKRGVVAAVHAGWRGTAAAILRRTLLLMKDSFRCLPEDVLVAVGPSIRQCSYEVDAHVMENVRSATGDGDYIRADGDKYFIDLAAANRSQAISEGIPDGNIWQSTDCTYCMPDKYYSYRYGGGKAGRQGGFIELLHDK